MYGIVQRQAEDGMAAVHSFEFLFRRLPGLQVILYSRVGLGRPRSASTGSSTAKAAAITAVEIHLAVDALTAVGSLYTRSNHCRTE